MTAFARVFLFVSLVLLMRGAVFAQTTVNSVSISPTSLNCSEELTVTVNDRELLEATTVTVRLLSDAERFVPRDLRIPRDEEAEAGVFRRTFTVTRDAELEDEDTLFLIEGERTFIFVHYRLHSVVEPYHVRASVTVDCEEPVVVDFSYVPYDNVRGRIDVLCSERSNLDWRIQNPASGNTVSSGNSTAFNYINVYLPADSPLDTLLEFSAIATDTDGNSTTLLFDGEPVFAFRTPASRPLADTALPDAIIPGLKLDSTGQVRNGPGNVLSQGLYGFNRGTRIVHELPPFDDSHFDLEAFETYAGNETFIRQRSLYGSAGPIPYLRVLDSITNLTEEERTHSHSISNLLIDYNWGPLFTSRAESRATSSDAWVLAEKPSGNAPLPRLGWVFGDGAPPLPSSVTWNDYYGQLDYTYNVTIPPGETVSFLQFIVITTEETASRDQTIDYLNTLRFLGGRSLTGLTAEQLATIVNFRPGPLIPSPLRFDFEMQEAILPPAECSSLSFFNPRDTDTGFALSTETPWLSLVPDNGVVGPGQTVTAQLCLNEQAAALRLGEEDMEEFVARVRVTELSPGNPEMVVPVTLRIERAYAPVLVSDSHGDSGDRVVDFGRVGVPFEHPLRVTLRNEGATPLHIADMYLTSRDFRDPFLFAPQPGWLVRTPEFWKARDNVWAFEPDRPIQGSVTALYTHRRYTAAEHTLRFRTADGAGPFGVVVRATDDFWFDPFDESARGSGVLVMIGRNQARLIVVRDGGIKYVSTRGISITTGEWNDFRLRADGNHFAFDLNGGVLEEFFHSGAPPSGFAGLVGFDNALVEFDDVGWLTQATEDYVVQYAQGQSVQTPRIIEPGAFFDIDLLARVDEPGLLFDALSIDCANSLPIRVDIRGDMIRALRLSHEPPGLTNVDGPWPMCVSIQAPDGQAPLDPASAILEYRHNDGEAFASVPLLREGNSDTWCASLPPAPVSTIYGYRFRARNTEGQEATLPGLDET
ncbi:MAG: hypothetical protein RLY93_13500 [Sumerlaeia bacterium]